MYKGYQSRYRFAKNPVRLKVLIVSLDGRTNFYSSYAFVKHHPAVRLFTYKFHLHISPMPQFSSIEIAKSYLHFSAAHFTIFSATDRERLHGHNWRLAAEITGCMGDDGLCFDYAIYKKILKDLCQQFDEYTLIAENSPHLSISEDDEYYFVTHNGRSQPLLKTDTILLPIANVTIEALSAYFLDLLISDKKLLDEHQIHRFEVRISSGPNQWGISRWSRDD